MLESQIAAFAIAGVLAGTSIAAIAETALPAGNWFGATSIESLPEMVRVSAIEQNLKLSYEDTRKCALTARHVSSDGEVHQYAIDESSCSHIAIQKTVLTVRASGNTLQYKLIRSEDKKPAEVGTLYRR